MKEFTRPPELNRLPKRLLAYVSELESTVRAYQRNERATSPTKVWIAQYSHREETRSYLPDDTKVHFKFSERDILTVRETHNGLEIASHGLSGSGLIVRPEVSNVIWVAPSLPEVDRLLQERPAFTRRKK